MPRTRIWKTITVNGRQQRVQVEVDPDEAHVVGAWIRSDERKRQGFCGIRKSSNSNLGYSIVRDRQEYAERKGY